MALDPARQRATIEREQRRERRRPWMEAVIGLVAMSLLLTGVFFVRTARSSTTVALEDLLGDIEFGDAGTGADTSAAADPGSGQVGGDAAATPAAQDAVGGERSVAELDAPQGTGSEGPVAGGSTAGGSEEAAPTNGGGPAAAASSDPSPESSADDQAASPAVYAMPAEGIYAYATSGYESLSMAAARHDYPDTTWMILEQGDGCNFTLDHRILEEKRVVQTLCNAGPAITKVAYDSWITFFGQTVESHYVCDGGTVADRRDVVGHTPHSGACAEANASSHDRIWLVGIEPLVIGGERIDAVRYHSESELRGDVTGHSQTEAWYHPETGLPLRVERRTTSYANAFGGDVEYNEDATFELISLTPQR